MILRFYTLGHTCPEQTYYAHYVFPILHSIRCSSQLKSESLDGYKNNGSISTDQLRPQKNLRFHKDTKHLILNLLFIRKRVKLSRQLNSYYPSFKALL